MSNMNTIMEKLGIPSLRPEQEKILPTILRGDDVSVILRTGGGKSLLYQLPALAGPITETTVVFSPLIALQADQVSGLAQRRAAAMKRGYLGFIESVVVNASMTPKERKAALDRIASRGVQLVYLAPEQLENKDTLAALADANILRVVVDEAHVLPTAAKGYRPAFGHIGEWISTLPKKPQILTFSATMTKQDLKFIWNSLGMEKPIPHQFPIRRDNLKIAVKQIGVAKGKQDSEKLEWLRMQAITRALKQWKDDGSHGSVVIYCSTVGQVKRVYKWLDAHKWTVTSYHGKQKRKKREVRMAAFMSGDVPIMVATNAFGLGVDKENIRLIIHASPPVSMDGYIQEIGRAGRDGKPARCVMFYASSDWALCQRIIGKGGKKRRRLDALKQLVSKKKFKWTFVEKYFGH